jgi:hypothetical protein
VSGGRISLVTGLNRAGSTRKLIVRTFNPDEIIGVDFFVGLFKACPVIL